MRNESTRHCRPTANTARGGFTLIELLMVISMIAVLSIMALLVLRGAQEDALSSRTRTIIQRSQTVLQFRLESFETRMMNFRRELIEGFTPAERYHLENWRRRTLFEWIRAEMPSYYSDLRLPPPGPGPGPAMFLSNYSRLPNALPYAEPQHWPAEWCANYTALMTLRPTAGYLAMVQAIGDPVPPTSGLRDVTNRDSLIEGAVLLYAILHNTWYNDQRGTHFLHASEIGYDAAGRPYVMDAWGEPLIFEILPNGSRVDYTVPGNNFPELTDYEIVLRSTRNTEL